MHLEIGAPFPRVALDAATVDTIAPGVETGEYDLTTAAGPIVVHAVSIAPNAPNIRLNSVLAGNALASSGETISSMAQRTGAIAGINGDYFDIGATNRPTNVVVEGNALIQTPSKRYALLIPTSGAPQFAETTFAGTLQLGDRSVALNGVNQMPPPDGGVSLITPAFGTVPPSDDVTLASVQVVNGAPPFATYRVSAIADNTVAQPAGYYVAIGLNAYASAGVPNPGDTVTGSGDLSPIGLSNLAAAIGGGPLILDGGQWYDDPDGPSGGEFDQRIPCSGAAIGADGTLYLIEVDGRQPDRSVGVTRPEFAALMSAFGAVRGMAFDGGGSSEVVARMPGDADARLLNDPSDGRERKVADGIFVYDTASIGPPSQLVAQPEIVRAMPGASVGVRFAPVDASYRVVEDTTPIETRVDPATLGSYRDGVFVAERAGDGTIVARAGGLIARIPVQVLADPARVVILPREPSVERGGRMTLRARAYDAQGYALALPLELPWRASGASIASDGTLDASNGDAVVSLLLGDHLADARVTVGFHDAPLAANPSFMSVPQGGDGSVGPSPTCPICTQLRYSLGPQERAAYLMTAVDLPERSVAVAFDVFGDGRGAHLKIALRNAINEEVLLPAATLDHSGWQHVDVRFPENLAQPARLVAIYVIGGNAMDAVAGTIDVKDLHAIVAGSGADRP
jgi:hypothetical protein